MYGWIGFRAATMITIHQRPAEETRTPENVCRYEAEPTVDGKQYSARSRRGAPMALARMLVSAGIADQPVTVTHAGLRGEITYRSLHSLAGRTIEESARTPVRDARYREYPGGEDAGDGAVFRAVAEGGTEQKSVSIAGPDVAVVALSEEPEIAATPAPELRLCPSCEKEFRATRRASRFCSPGCRLRGHRAQRLAAGEAGAPHPPELDNAIKELAGQRNDTPVRSPLAGLRGAFLLKAGRRGCIGSLP